MPFPLRSLRASAIALALLFTTIARADEVPVRFEVDDPSVKILRRSGVALGTEDEWRRQIYYRRLVLLPSYTPLCETNCDLELEPGVLDLALQKGDGVAVVPNERVVFTGPSVVHAHYADRSGLRLGGMLALFGGAAAGLGLTLAGSMSNSDATRNGMYEGALACLVTGVLFGAILGTQKDSATFTVNPL